MTSLAKKIHDENVAGNFMINLAGLGIGNGIIAPEHNTLYADYLYQVRITKKYLGKNCITGATLQGRIR